MKSRLSLGYPLSLFLFSALTVTAQEQTSQVTTRVDLVSLGETIPGLYLGSKKVKRVSALPFRYQSTLRYQGKRIIEINQISTTSARPEKKISDEDKEHEIKPPKPRNKKTIELEQRDNIAKSIAKRREKNPYLVALASVPAGARHITILLTPAENNTYRTTVINDDPTKLPYGTMRVHNFCNHPISMRFNNAKAAIIPPLMNRQVSPNPNHTITYLLGYPKNKKWKIQESNIINVTPKEQVQMVIIQSQSSYFKSSSGSLGGRLQVAVLRRDRSLKKTKPGDPSKNNDKPALPDGLVQ